MLPSINWQNFITFNNDSRGVRFKFEDLCRQLFANENIPSDSIGKVYLHSNPNNAGLETDPVFIQSIGKKVGFQVKFFDAAVDYEQIKSSAKAIVSHYSGQVDLVYLFCNKPITVSAKGYRDTVQLLQDANIEIKLITDNAILDLVRNYPYLALYYFGAHSISTSWFISHSENIFDAIGERFNREFNVSTNCNAELSLFVWDDDAVETLNGKKKKLISEINQIKWHHEPYLEYLNKIMELTEKLDDIDFHTICQAVSWYSTVSESIADYVAELSRNLEEYKNRSSEKYEDYLKAEKESEKKAAYSQYRMYEEKVRDIEQLISLPDELALSAREAKLLESKILFVSGKAGTGKTQLLAFETKKMLDNERPSLFLIGGDYCSEETIETQIMRNLGLPFDIEELIDILDAIGEKEDCFIPIFIDAINESWNAHLWKSGLPKIIQKIERSKKVKLVISYRPEYKRALLSEMLINRCESGDIIHMYHYGFEDNTVEAIREFLNHHNIPFTPMEYFSFEMSNPLFLTLYCKTYNGEEVGLPDLYERIIEQANNKIFETHGSMLLEKGYSYGYKLIQPLVNELASLMNQKNERSVSKDDLCGLRYWTEHGLTPVPMISLLVKEHLLHDSFYDEEERFFFAYDQMNDYYCAKAILNQFTNKADLRKYLSDSVLRIQNGKALAIYNIDLFVNACALYSEKYGEECIDILDDLSDEDDIYEIFSRYLDSYQWRNGRNVNSDYIWEAINKYPCDKDAVWKMLIGNSIKTNHPLNADFLHKRLSGYSLNKRDYLWTTYINELAYDESDRITQIVQLYNRGEKLDVKDEKQLKLLLTLLGWLLTSSNRWLRDHASKAMIEILKDNFSLCIEVLRKFNGNNDPYVVQRLYGIVFGACSKRTHNGADADEFKKLAEYVYDDVFNKEEVYPDILMRDYARLIIEKYLFETSGYEGSIDITKVRPPYRSAAIPEIEKQYLDIDYEGAAYWLVSSMRFEGMGMYGDFGRYVFQSALKDFEIDEKTVLNYSLYYIFNVLGYNEEFFGEYDRHCGSSYRHVTIKKERIGKKYQWITMYNVLARVSDNNKMKNRWSSESEDLTYEGPWEPYVRDFDPTLNSNFMEFRDAPVFSGFGEYIEKARREELQIATGDTEAQRLWLEEKGAFHQDIKDILILQDETGREWVPLTTFIDTGIHETDRKKLVEWSWLYAYFATPEQRQELKGCSDKGLSLMHNGLNTHSETYTVYNREYPWAPSCGEITEYAWVDAKVKTGKTYEEKITVPDFSCFEPSILIDSIDDSECESDDLDSGAETETSFGLVPKEKEIVRTVDEERDIGKMLHASSHLLWEEEYDASKNDTISIGVPCALLIDQMKLCQLQYDGFYFDSDSKLAAFDLRITQNQNAVVVRKDLLDAFLAQNGYELIWIVQSEKEIHTESRNISSWSTWEGMLVYDGDTLSGDINQIIEQR